MKKLRLFGVGEDIFNKTMEIDLPDDCIGISFTCGDKKQTRFAYHLFDKEEIKDIKHGRIAHIYYSWEPEEDDIKTHDHSVLERELANGRKIAV